MIPSTYLVGACHCDKEHTERCLCEVYCVKNIVSKAFASAMALHAMYDRSFHASNFGLISQDLAADAASS